MRKVKIMLISVVFSFKNEEEVLPELVRRSEAVLSKIGCDYEMIFVNDASNDSSLELLLAMRERDSKIKIISMSRTFGVTPCVIAGIKHAKGDAVVYMDTDLQDPPELLPALLKKYREGFDVVHTTRTRRKGENPFKMFVTRCAYRFINIFSEIDIPHNTGDFKLISRRAVDYLVTLNEYDPFMRGLVRWVGFKQTFVPYERDPRFAGKTKFSLFRSLNPAKEFIRGMTSFSETPLYLSLFTGFFISIGAFVYLIKIIIERVVLKIHNPGWPAIMVTMLFLGGTILFMIGVLGIYLGKIHSAIKQRPPYIIESTAGFPEHK
jgi:glycosyltransferase involved in cell wall biosynthesis